MSKSSTIPAPTNEKDSLNIQEAEELFAFVFVHNIIDAKLIVKSLLSSTWYIHKGTILMFQALYRYEFFEKQKGRES